jgi:endonuclease YncB( thermonuclease family)
VVLAYTSGDVSAKDAALVLGGQVLPLRRTLVDELDAKVLDRPEPLAIAQATITATDGASLTVTTATGVADTVALAGVAMPPADGCFGPESSSAVASLTGGTIWVQDDPVGKGKLVWYWDGAKGGLALLNQSLVEQGFAGYGPTGSTVLAPWLGGLTSDAREAGTGLWSMCKNAAGEWINEPTPSAEEVRGQYQIIDARDLVIRPGEFEGEKIMVTGSVFNIQVDGNLTVMQIWLDGAPGEAAVIAYQGNSRGIYEGTWISVYGVGAGTFTGTNGFGATIVQPLIRADIVDF